MKYYVPVSVEQKYAVGKIEYLYAASSAFLRIQIIVPGLRP
jgi:hypothetical protein